MDSHLSVGRSEHSSRNQYGYVLLRHYCVGNDTCKLGSAYESRAALDVLQQPVYYSLKLMSTFHYTAEHHGHYSHQY